MATKEAHSRANIEYNKRQDNIMIRPPKELGAKIREAAQEHGMSVQAFVLQTLYARIGIDTTGVVKNIEGEPLTVNTASCLFSPAQKEVLNDLIKSAMSDKQYTEAEIESEIKEAVHEFFNNK